jgi:hypothetical protein
MPYPSILFVLFAVYLGLVTDCAHSVFLGIRNLFGIATRQCRKVNEANTILTLKHFIRLTGLTIDSSVAANNYPDIQEYKDTHKGFSYICLE